MARPRVYLAVGHGLTAAGRFDPGAAGNGWTEQSAGDAVVAAAADQLAADGAEVRHEAHADDPNYAGTARAANAWGADVCVSVHFDTANAPPGSFAYHAPGSTAGAALASTIIRYVDAAGYPTRPAWLGPGKGFHDGPVAPRSLHVLTRTTMPAVLLEVGPIGHGSLDTRAELELRGLLLADAIAAHLSLTAAPDKAPDVKPPTIVLYVDPRAPLPDGVAAWGALAAARFPGSILTHDAGYADACGAAGARVIAVGAADDLAHLPARFERLTGAHAAETIGAAAAATADW